MLVLPLGLGSKLKRSPSVTLALAFLWILSFLVDRSGLAIFGGIFGIVSETGVRDRARELFVDYCKSRKGQAADCKKYAVLVWTGYPGKGELPAGHLGDREDAYFAKLTAEHAAAAKVKAELLECKESRRCFTYKDILWTFLDQSHQHYRRFANLGSYKTYASALRSYRQKLRGVCEEHSCLVQTNINVASLAAAQLRHGDILHLLGNMVMFLIFGMYAEQRSSRVVYLLTLVIGGTLGMAVHAAFFSSGDTIALGGSANVSAAMGMFFVYFYRQNLRLRVWLPRKLYYGTTFAAPVALAFPLVFVLSDVIGGFDPGFRDLTPASVAHFAHLTGFAVGAAVAYLVSRLRPLPLPFIYESELRDMKRLEACRDPRLALERAEAMALVNPDNVHALECGAHAFLRWAAANDPSADLPLFDRGRAFLAAHLPNVTKINAEKGALLYAARLLSHVPMYMPFVAYLGDLGQRHCLLIGDFAATNGHPLLGLRLYDFFLTRYAGARQRAAVEATAASVLTYLPATPENARALELFRTYHPKSRLAPLVAAWEKAGEAA